MVYDSLSILTLGLAAAFFVGLGKGGLANAGMVAMPLLSLVMAPTLAAGLLLPVFLFSDVISVVLYRKSFAAGHLALLLPFGLLGILLGWCIVPYIPVASIELLVGGLGVVFCVRLFLRRGREPKAPPGTATGGICGVLTGLTSFMTHSGAVPFQVYMLPQKLPPTVYAGTSTLFFAALNFAKLPAYTDLGLLSHGDFERVIWLLPAAVVGTFVGRLLVGKISPKLYFGALAGLLFAVSATLVIRSVAQMWLSII